MPDEELTPANGSNLQYEEIADLQFQNIDSPPAPSILNIAAFPDDNDKIIRTKLLQETTRRNWWLQEYWRKKGTPQEQFVINTPKGILQVFNFNPRALSQEQLKQLQETVQFFLTISGGLLFNKVKFILIDDIQATNIQAGEDSNGYGLLPEMAVKLYPRALDSTPHRVPGVSNFQGTLIHEFTEFLTDQSQKEWKAIFWQHSERPVVLPGGTQTSEVPIEPSRCVTSYAAFRVRDDIADSMVALLKHPDLLDLEKAQLLREGLEIPNDFHPQQITSARLTGNEIKLPQVEQPVKYRIVPIKPPGN